MPPFEMPQSFAPMVDELECQALTMEQSCRRALVYFGDVICICRAAKGHEARTARRERFRCRLCLKDALRSCWGVAKATEKANKKLEQQLGRPLTKVTPEELAKIPFVEGGLSDRYLKAAARIAATMDKLHRVLEDENLAADISKQTP